MVFLHFQKYVAKNIKAPLLCEILASEMLANFSELSTKMKKEPSSKRNAFNRSFTARIIGFHGGFAVSCLPMLFQQTKS